MSNNNYYPKNSNSKIYYINSNSSGIIHYMVVIIICIIFSFIVQYFIKYLYDKLWLDKNDTFTQWWNKYATPDQKNKFDITLIHKWEDDDKWMWWVRLLFYKTYISEVNWATVIDFFTRYVRPHIYTKVRGKQYNDSKKWIMPRHLIESIQIQTIDMDSSYNDWISHDSRQDENKISANKYNPIEWRQTALEWRKRIFWWSLSKTQKTKTPGVLDSLFDCFWSKSKSGSNYILTLGSTGSGCNGHKGFGAGEIMTNWFATLDERQLVNSDNIFARYGILPTCPAILDLCNKNVDGASAGEMNHRDAVLLLLGIDPNTGNKNPTSVLGGWVGFLNTMSSVKRNLNWNQFLFEQEDRGALTSNPWITPCPVTEIPGDSPSGRDIAGGWVAALGSAGAAFAFGGGPGPLGFGAALGSLIGSIGSNPDMIGQGKTPKSKKICSTTGDAL